MEYQEIINSCYCGDAAEKLIKANKLSEKYGLALLQQREVQKQLAAAKDASEVLNTHMAAMEMGKTCTRCAAMPKGGCCGVYMGNENNDVLQLLMNMLAGVKVEITCSNGVDCCFLGARGCIFLYKPIFCLNYLCEHIQSNSSRKHLFALEHKTGTLLTAQSTLEQIIIRFLQKQS